MGYIAFVVFRNVFEVFVVE